MDPDVLIAARDGRVETLRELFANGADPNASNRIGRTALHFACMYGHADAASVLLDAGAVTGEDDDGISPQFIAVRKGHVEVVRLLIQRGANVRELRGFLKHLQPDLPNPAEMVQLVAMHLRPSVLSRAIKTINLEKLGQLLDEGKFSDTDEWEDVRGRTPMHFAVAAVLATVSMRLEQKHEDPFGDSDALTALKMLVGAAERAGEGAMRHRCECLDDDGRSPLHLLVQDGPCTHPAALSMLLRAGASPNVQAPPSEYTTSRGAAALGRGARGGGTPLHMALEQEEPSVPAVRLMLESHADPNRRDGEQRTALHLALDFGEDRGGIDLGLCALLLQHGADPALGSPEIGLGNSCLHAACAHNKPDLVRLLLHHGASPSAVGKGGWTPLALAARSKAAKIFEALLAAGADPSATTPSGGTVRELAAANRCDAVLDALDRAAGELEL